MLDKIIAPLNSVLEHPLDLWHLLRYSQPLYEMRSKGVEETSLRRLVAIGSFSAHFLSMNSRSFFTILK